jgi:hypothetical protein
MFVPSPRRSSHFTTAAFGLFLAAALDALAGCSDSNQPAGSNGSSGGNTGDASSASDTAAAASGATSNEAGAGADGDAAAASGSDGSGTQDGSATTNDGAMADGAGGDGAVADGAGAHGDSAAGTLTLPVQRGGLDVLEFGPLQFAVNPGLGARIVSFKLDGDELLTDATANAMYFGSSLWTSPATDWVGAAGVIPPAPLDRDPYTTTVSADGVITATSAPFTVSGKMLTVTKVFTADIPNQAIVIDYKITNAGTAAFQMAHWEVTRVFPDGLTFFPTGTITKPDVNAQVMKLQQAQGYTWYDNTTQVKGNGESQGGFDTPGGFIAHDAPNHPKGDLLFVKTFKVITAAMAPPGHFPVAIYSSNPHTYTELEEHSAYTSIAPGTTYTQTVHWYLRRLPVGTDRSIGSAALLAATKTVTGK